MLEDNILREIGALTRTIHAIIEITFKPLNLQKGQSIYLARICEAPGISMKELCQLLMVDKTATSKVIKKLIGEGLVEKEQDASDKRAYKLFPTQRAKEAYQTIIDEENRLTRQCYEGLDAGEKEVLKILIRKMRKNIEDDWLELKRYKPAEPAK